MADVKTLNANNNSYNIKDETARTDIANIKTGRNFSTNEIDTGMTWVDGKKIYRKCYSYNGTVAVGEGVSFPGFTDVAEIINMVGTFVNANDNHVFPCCYVNANNDGTVTQVMSLLFAPEWHSVQFINCIGFPCKNFRIYIEYTKA